jgi:16S rRNA (adenine1518-N6/adenine1519-N6)-dimethyltransferase
MNIASSGAVKELLQKFAVAPLKRYGQNFLTDANIAEKIAASAVPEGACALEIGPGLGALTQRLLARCRCVAAYEIDSGLVRALGETFKGEEKLKVFHKDFLKADIEADIPPLLEGDIYVAANLPYYVTTDCIMKLLESGLDIKAITVMVQKEFAERLLAAPGGEDYGMLNAAVNFFADASVLFDVAPTCFFPAPHVGSSVVRLEMKGVDKEYAKEYLGTLRCMFAAKRKTARSNLRQSLGLTVAEADAVLQESGINENARAETLSVIDFENITKNLKHINKI